MSRSWRAREVIARFTNDAPVECGTRRERRTEGNFSSAAELCSASELSLSQQGNKVASSDHPEFYFVA
jgi:hypothetical protein